MTTTRRERLENKAEKREEWAGKADARADAAHDRSTAATAGIPFGQPILVGHHSESRHRNAIKRSDAAMRRGVDESDKASNHRSKAAGLRSQLARTIFSDDDDAIGALTTKIERLEAERSTVKRINAAWRKAGKPTHDDADGWDTIAASLDMADVHHLSAARQNLRHDCCSNRAPYPPYVSTNIGGRIKAAKVRIESIKRQAAAREAAEAAGGVTVTLTDGPLEVEKYATVTFAEKPDYSVIRSLKDAGFRWSGGSWWGLASGLPDSIGGASIDAEAAS